MNQLQPLTIEHAYMTFLFPFAYQEKKKAELIQLLTHKGFTFFNIHNTELENHFYGDHIQISHEELDQFFYPFVEAKLFPETSSDEGFLRFSQPLELQGTFQVREEAFPFTLLSIDITLCPFEIGVVTLRVAMQEEARDLSDVLDFIHFFRVMHAKLEEEKGSTLTVGDYTFYSTEELILSYLLPYIKPYLQKNSKMEGYYGSLPYFEDERMLSSAFIVCEEGAPIEDEHLFRIGQIDSKKPTGEPFISSTNELYINNYVTEHVHDRWAPNIYTMTSAQAQMTISNLPFSNAQGGLKDFMSTRYYNILIHYFYKIMLLKLTFEHSEIRWGKDKVVVETLIQKISKFSSRYYFGEIAVRTEGRELSQFLQKAFRIPPLYKEIKATLNELYRVQEDLAKGKHSQLLFVLTVYTVISGIYGMNLVIMDWKGEVDWSLVANYSIFEWITLITALSGIAIAFILILSVSIRSIMNYFRRK